ncbi:putative transmembrane protein [Streptococcus pneumoniae]|nr:putative transmembrane protein [Streptococcus pneumoniae]VNN46573.1 putative transmembrane protein [Streptococcus pneumoniae]VOP90479.1 putative transmembrane protein [Streptococcus pneumoniae]VRN76822.1 putative transmembrane protein [Streptococcus pneumoniae]VSQ67986.1 putative transmembrane protein [Streptococcus pneumoniae]
MRRNILLGFILSIFFFPFVASATEPILPNNNFNIIEFDKNTNTPKLTDPAENAKKILDNAKKAKETQDALKKKEEESSKLTFENYKSKMSDLTSKVYFDKKFFGFDSNMNYFFNSIVQAVFWVSKFIFWIIAGIYGAVDGMSDITSLLNNTIDNSSKVFSSLFSKEVVYVVGASMAVYLLYLFATGKGSVMKSFIKMVLIYTLIGLYFIRFNVDGQNKYLLAHLYDGFRTTTITLNGEITKTLTSESSNEIDAYFNDTIIKAYKYMNSPVKEDGSFQLSDKEFEDLAGYKQGDGDHLVGEKKIKDIAKDKDPENKMLKNEWGAKFSYAFASLVDVIVVGSVYLVLGLSRFFFLMVYIFLILILPFILLISLFPKMEHLIHGFNKKAISMLILSSVTLLATTLFVFFYNSLTDFIGYAVGENVLVVIFVKAILLVLMIKNRAMILSMFSRIGRLPVSRINGFNLNKGTKTIREKLYRTGKDGLVVSGQFAKGGLKMGKESLQARLKNLRLPTNNLDKKQGLTKEQVFDTNENETYSRVRDGYATVKHRTTGTVNALKEKGNRAMSFLYEVRTNAFRNQESNKFIDLNSKRKSFGTKADYHEKIKNSSRNEVKRLREKRLARKKAEFQAKVDKRMNQVNPLNKVSPQKSKINSPKSKRMKGGKISSLKKKGRDKKVELPNVNIERKRGRK